MTKIVKQEIILLRYGEIGLKSKPIRRQFEKTLISNIKNNLKIEKIEFEISKQHGRIYVHTEQIEKSIQILKKIFGITSISPCFRTDSSFNSMRKLTLNITRNNITKDDTFAIRSTRTGTHNFTSQDVAVFLGNCIVEKTKASVDLTKPDITLNVEIRDNFAYLFFKKILCVGGMPLGSQGRILGLINSKESILAIWYLMRRGCNPVFAVIDNSFNRIINYFTKNWYVTCPIYEIKPKEIRKLAGKFNCSAVVTGYKINDFKKIKNLKKQFDIPILYPLIGLDDKQIKNKIKEIGLEK